jgi:hypothetical protein
MHNDHFRVPTGTDKIHTSLLSVPTATAKIVGRLPLHRKAIANICPIHPKKPEAMAKIGMAD